jgi:hypothetical protein
MRQHFVRNAFCALLTLTASLGMAVSTLAGPTPTPAPTAMPTPTTTPSAVPQDLDFFTNFEDVFPNTVPGEIIVVGLSPTTANLGGNAFGGQVGVGRLYHSGIRAWMVLPKGTGTITFENDAATVAFWARVRRSASGGGDTIITAFSGSDVIVDGPVTINPGTGWHLVSFSGRIARIDVVNLDDTRMNGIDDFGFTPAPEPIGVEIDISPFRLINRVQLGSHQRVLVVILGSEIIDVSSVDVATLSFGPDGAPSSPDNKPALLGDRNRDGFTDLLVRFDMDETGIAAGDTQTCLTGEIDGALFEGCATVETFALPGSEP